MPTFPKSIPVRFAAIHFGLPLILLAGVVAALRPGGLDLAISAYWYDGEDWYGDLNPTLYLFYEYGTGITGGIFSLSFSVFLLTFAFARFRRLRLASGYAASCYLLGPGLLVNGLLKPFVPRARPASLKIFHDWNEYCALFSSCPGGASFPSGHVAAYSFLGCFLFILGKSSRRAAFVASVPVVASIVLMSLARVTQGGHYLSDVLFSVGLVHMVNAALYLAFNKLETPRLSHNAPAFNPSPVRKVCVISAVSVFQFSVSLFGIMSFNHTESGEGSAKIPENVRKILIRADLGEEDVSIRFSEGNEIGYRFVVRGAAVPWGKYSAKAKLAAAGPEAIYNFGISRPTLERFSNGEIFFTVPRGVEVAEEIETTGQIAYENP